MFPGIGVEAPGAGDDSLVNWLLEASAGRGSLDVSLLLPAMMVSRLSSKKAPPDDKSKSSELRLPNFINRAFEGVMHLERLLIRSGIRFPVGGSLLLIARKPIEVT